MNPDQTAHNEGAREQSDRGPYCLQRRLKLINR